MKKILTALVGLTAMSMVGVGAIENRAEAADLGGPPARYGSIKDAPFVPPPLVWTGFYIGAHIGGNWTDYSVTGFGGAFDNGGITKYDLSPSGVIGGFQLGYNWQAGNAVIGIEGDYSFGRHSETHSPTVPGSDDFRDDFARFEFGPTATLTGRLGWAAGPWLPYVKGGAAWAKIKGSAGDTDLPGFTVDPTDLTSFSEWRSGWTIGGGVEYMLSRNWTAKLEYQFMDFGSFTTSNLDGDTFRHEITNQSVKLGVNYKF